MVLVELLLSDAELRDDCGADGEDVVTVLVEALEVFLDRLTWARFGQAFSFGSFDKLGVVAHGHVEFRQNFYWHDTRVRSISHVHSSSGILKI
jgi:hypothetical protein